MHNIKLKQYYLNANSCCCYSQVPITLFFFAVFFFFFSFTLFFFKAWNLRAIETFLFFDLNYFRSNGMKWISFKLKLIHIVHIHSLKKVFVQHHFFTFCHILSTFFDCNKRKSSQISFIY